MTYASSTRLSASPRLVPQQAPTSFFQQLMSAPYPERPTGIVSPAVYDFFLNPLTPFVFGITYFAVTKTLSHYQDGKNRIQGKGWNAFVIFHNLTLAVYSAWTFLSTAPVFFGAFYRGWREAGLAGLAHALCDSDALVWTATKFPSYCFYFYLSKFYEIVDTAIILAKGKKVGLLQSYHHMGAVWTMFAGFRTASMPIWIFVVFNSFIHSLMYIFYSCSALKLPFPQFLKRSLTRLQIAQFIFGGSLAASYLFIKLPVLSDQQRDAIIDRITFGHISTVDSLSRMGTECLVNTGQKAAVYLNVAYLIPLTALFVQFFYKSYRAKARKAAKAE
ncbi:hypothetical protein T439DRAFT_199602 [Meredithblackwellia eburnea MCA 4105]